MLVRVNPLDDDESDEPLSIGGGVNVLTGSLGAAGGFGGGGKSGKLIGGNPPDSRRPLSIIGWII